MTDREKFQEIINSVEWDNYETPNGEYFDLFAVIWNRVIGCYDELTEPTDDLLWILSNVEKLCTILNEEKMEKIL